MPSTTPTVRTRRPATRSSTSLAVPVSLLIIRHLGHPLTLQPSPRTRPSTRPPSRARRRRSSCPRSSPSARPSWALALSTRLVVAVRLQDPLCQLLTPQTHTAKQFLTLTLQATHIPRFASELHGSQLYPRDTNKIPEPIYPAAYPDSDPPTM